MTTLRAKGFRAWFAVLVAVIAVGLAAPALAQGKKLSIAYMPHPIHEQQLKWMKKWGEMKGVEIKPTPISTRCTSRS